jgi:hypothetical protein
LFPTLRPDPGDERPALLEQTVNDGIRDFPGDVPKITRAALNKAFNLKLKAPPKA